MTENSILIVEDEEIVAMDIEYKLTRLGYAVAGQVSTGEMVIQKIIETKPSLVLMDIKLAGPMDGIEAAGLVQRSFDIPIVYLTAYADSATLQRAKISEPFGYIVKPFENVELHTAIEMALYKHQMQKELRAQRQWLLTTLRSIGDAVITTDTQGRVTFMNPVAERLTGWKIDQALNKPIAEVFKTVDEESGQLVNNPVLDCLSGRKAVALANGVALITKSTATMPIVDSAAPIIDENNIISGAVLVFQDNTVRRAAERELANERNLLRTLIDNLPDQIYVKDVQGRFLVSNVANAQAAGLNTPDDLIGKTDAEVFSSQLATKMEADDETVLKTGHPLTNQELASRDEAGRQQHLLSTKVPLVDETGQIAGLVGIQRDITRQKKNEADREMLIDRLQAALDNVKHLQGLLPICASCKKIRDDQGYWHQVENYIEQHADVQFSHGLCEDCLQELYPDFYDDIAGDIDLDNAGSGQA